MLVGDSKYSECDRPTNNDCDDAELYHAPMIAASPCSVGSAATGATRGNQRSRDWVLTMAK